jgi:predicted enzyme related to lactoylglutathione lyase
MSMRLHHPIGSFCRVDLATGDPVAAADFYRALFGWEAIDAADAMGKPYLLLTKDGRDVAGVTAPAAAAIGGRSFWQSYVAVSDAEASAARAVDLGGTVVLAPADVGSAGRAAFVRDPGGAVIGLWQGREHQGAALINAVEARCWNELRTGMPDAAAAFYCGLFAWHVRVSATMPGGGYRIFCNDGRECAGLLQTDAQWTPETAGLQSCWCVYFCVADCDATTARATAEGGRVIGQVMDIDRIGRFVSLQDPQGAVFSIIQLASDHA